MYEKKHNLILARKILQNVIARLILIWVFLMEWVSVVGLWKANTEILPFIFLQMIFIGGILVSRDMINTVILIKIEKDKFTFFLANNKVLSYKKEQLAAIRKRYVTLGGFRFVFQDGTVLKSNNQAMRLRLLKNGVIYTDDELSNFVNGVNAEEKR